MKKKSTNSQSAFLNLRVLIGLFVMLAGVFLALVSFGTFSRVFAKNGMTREEMTLTLAKALDVFQPPACVPGSEMFNDVPASSPFCPFIEELSRRGITGGCAPGLFCPGDPVTRQQMAVFLVKGIFPEPFHIVGTAGEPPFQNGWTNFNPALRTLVGFYIDSTNVVHFKGSLFAGASSTVAFTLPAGYRPAAQLLVPVADGGGSNVKELLINNDGTVQVFCETAAACTGSSTGLDAVSFRVGTGGASSITESPSAAPKGNTPDGY
jgi:S-layer homology domain